MTYGEPITASELNGRTGLDLLARMVYAKALGETEMGRRGVASVAQYDGFDNGWINVVERHVLGGHTFFRVEGY